MLGCLIAILSTQVAGHLHSIFKVFVDVFECLATHAGIKNSLSLANCSKTISGAWGFLATANLTASH